MSLQVAYRRESSLAAVVGFSGALADPTADGLKPAPTLLVHGTADEVLPSAMTEAAVVALEAANVPVDWHLVPGLGHGIDQTGLSMAIAHVARHLGG